MGGGRGCRASCAGGGEGEARGPERVATERRAVLARPDHRQHVTVRRDGGDRNHAAAEGLAQNVDVRDGAGQIAGEGCPGPAEAGLNLVGDQQRRAGRIIAGPPEVFGGLHDDTGLTLNGFQQNGHRGASIASAMASMLP